jgi:alpha-L-rhamnosidase
MFVLALCSAAGLRTAQDAVLLSSLKVNSVREPISLDDPKPSFSWHVDVHGRRSVVTEGYELELRRVHSNGTVTSMCTSGEVHTNQTQFVPLPSNCPPLLSDSDYSWKVRAYPGPSDWSESYLSTGLLYPSDWSQSEWIQSANATGKAAQMRKVFTIPQCTSISRARAFIALPGIGDVFINGQKVDGRAGTRSLSQYDTRALYHTYDVQRYLRAGENVIAVFVAVGWFGHPAGANVFGGPTLRALVSVETSADSAGGSGARLVAVGTDSTWLETPGPVVYEDIYNGTTYDARLETPGWTAAGYAPAAGGANWTSVLPSAAQPAFKLNRTTLTAATFAAVEVIEARPAVGVRMPSPGVYVYDFGQNMPGWCRLAITGRRGLRVQLRHAEVLMHPPYGPADGNVYLRNLRTAAATDLYILRGDPNGEAVEFSMSQVGLIVSRVFVVELTCFFPSTGSVMWS